jgi:hypothetical protein
VPASFEEHVEKALAALERVPTRDLIRTARAIEKRYKHDPEGMFRFASVFRSVAFDRRGDDESQLSRIYLSTSVIQAQESVAEMLADAPESFWQHVREAIAYRDEVAAYWASVEAETG